MTKKASSGWEEAFCYVRLALFFSERKAHCLEEHSRFIVCFSGSAEYDVHTSNSVEGIVGDFREHELFFQAHCVVASSVERFCGETLEVSDSWKNHGCKSVEEVHHSLTSEGDLASNFHSFSEFEVRNRFLCVRCDWLLSCDDLKVSKRIFEVLCILIGGAGTHVDDNLFQLWNLHHGFVAKLFHQSWSNFFCVFFSKS